MKKKCAVFTIVKDEKFFLPIWVKHFSKFFEQQDIYVLDHQSSDGCTDGLQCNVIQVENHLAFDHQWLCNTIQNFQSHLLNNYNAVIFSEVDELIYSIGGLNLTEYITEFIHSEAPYITCVGYEVFHDMKNEKPYKIDKPLFSQRKNWFKHALYDKTLLTKIPLNYQWGFHNCDHNKVFDNKLFLCHLHRFDFPLMLERHQHRVRNFNIKDDGGASFHQKIDKTDELLVYFNSIPCEPEFIPKEHLDCLHGI